MLAWLLLAAGLALFISAGRWQHGKAADKERAQQAWQLASTQPARAWTAHDLESAEGYDRVRLRGEWLPQRYMLDNQVAEGRVGVEVYAPLRPEGGGLVLVSLGWMPYVDARRTPPSLPMLPGGQVELVGALTPPTAHGLRLGRTWAQVAGYPKLMPYFALDEVAADLNSPLAPRVLRAEAVPGSGLVQSWHPVSSMPPARHRAYAWQWWSLAIAIVIVFLVVHRQRRSPP